MSDEVSHLTAGAVELLGETDERRIRAIRSRRWVLYPRAKQALDRLSRLLDVPRGTRMPSVWDLALMIPPDRNRRAAETAVYRLVVGTDDVERDVPLEFS